MWVPPEQTDPILLHAPTRKSVALFGAVNVRRGKFHYEFIRPFNADTFEQFLRSLLRRRDRGKRMVIILDNASYHHSKKIGRYVDDRSQAIELLFLPPYSPELNPIERVWKLTRRICTHNVYFEQLEDLCQTVGDQLARWFNPNDTLRRLCCIK